MWTGHKANVFMEAVFRLFFSRLFLSLFLSCFLAHVSLPVPSYSSLGLFSFLSVLLSWQAEQVYVASSIYRCLPFALDIHALSLYLLLYVIRPPNQWYVI
ncbi:hypothetical protein F5Y17DRAFT_100991 [Xylariaceae sp. FL0594]|nr:hypothetical protein F5Y17DRAFT_100991 [Xylariaceae sp. FL0594]